MQNCACSKLQCMLNDYLEFLKLSILITSRIVCAFCLSKIQSTWKQICSSLYWHFHDIV